MPPTEGRKRTDIGSRVICAPPGVIYRALLDPDAVGAWRPPEGMRARVYSFDARVGGGYRMAFEYTRPEDAHAGKTTDDADVFEGRFTQLVPDECVVEEVEFESGDPAFAGTMTVRTTLRPVDGGTEVVIQCEHVPVGIDPGDHAEGLASSLANLAAFTEAAAR